MSLDSHSQRVVLPFKILFYILLLSYVTFSGGKYPGGRRKTSVCLCSILLYLREVVMPPGAWGRPHHAPTALRKCSYSASVIGCPASAAALVMALSATFGWGGGHCLTIITGSCEIRYLACACCTCCTIYQ